MREPKRLRVRGNTLRGGFERGCRNRRCEKNVLVGDHHKVGGGGNVSIHKRRGYFHYLFYFIHTPICHRPRGRPMRETICTIYTRGKNLCEVLKTPCTHTHRGSAKSTLLPISTRMPSTKYRNAFLSLIQAVSVGSEKLRQ